MKQMTEDKSNNTAEQRQHLQDLMFRNVDDLMFIKDSNFRIVQANPAFLGLYPKEKRDKIIGFTTFEDYPEAQMLEFVAEDQKALNEGYSETQETIDFPDGNRRTLLTRKIGFNDLDGERYVFGISRDITKIKATESELASANQELEEFAYRVSHDLRSPLISSIQLLDRAVTAFDKDAIAEARKLVEVAQNSLTALERLATDILSVHQIRRSETAAETINLRAEIADIWARHQPEKGDILLNVSYQGHQSPQCDRPGLIHALENLISNAIKYRDKGDIESVVSIDSIVSDQNITIVVEDNGIGIPDRHKDQVFSMFQRFHPRHAIGSGLGLYMVSQWVLKVGGTIDMTPLDPGTRFTLVVPQIKLNQ